MSRLLKPLLYAAVVLLAGGSCKDKSPCIKGQCCGDGGDWDYVKTIQGARADLGNYTILIEDVEDDGTIICYNSFDKVKGMPLTFNYNPTKGIRPYNYRVWGKILLCKDCRPSTWKPVLYINLDKIEKVN